MTTTIVQNSFLPTQISGCQLWLDASDVNSLFQNTAGTTPVTAAGQQVQFWKDKSGNARNATSSDTAMTYNTSGIKYPSIYFTGAQATGFQVNVTVTDSTYFFVVNNAATAAATRVYNSHNGTSRLKINSWDSIYRTHMDYNTFIGLTGADNTSGVTLVMTRQDTLSTGLLNGWQTGTSIGSANATPVIGETFTSFVLGTYNGGSSFPMIGYMGEVIVYNSVLSTNQRQQVEGYLAWKWGVQANLPSNHLYKNSPGVFVTQPITLASLNITNRINNAVFLPTSISGCQLWLDGADPAGTGVVPANGATVSTWKDKSGNGRDGTATGTPSYSANVLNTLGSPLLSNTASYFTTPSFVASSTGAPTFFVVMKQTAYTGTGVNSDFFTNTSDYHYFDMFGQTNNYNVAITIYSSASTQTPLTANNVTNLNATFFSIVGTTAQNAAACYTNGSLYATTSGGGYNLTTSLAYRVGSGPGFNGYVYEALIYDNPLSTSQRQQVEGYLAWKWGLQVNLPPTHSYKKTSAVFVTQPTTLAALAVNPYNSMVISRYFNPTSIAGCALWLDGKDTSAASMTLSGTTLTTWKDKSGNGYNASGVNSPQLISTGGVSFNAVSGQYFALSTPFSSTHTVFIVSTTSPASSIYLFGRPFPGGGPTIILNYVGNSLEYYDGGTSGRQTLATTPTATYIASYIRTYGTGGSVVGRYNGSQIFTEAGPTTEASSLAWGSLANVAPYGGNLTGSIYEFLIYNATLNTSQAQQIEGYLAWKWGIQANLPATHPYKNYPTPPN